MAQAGGYSQAAWYAQYPHMYVGNASTATPEKGKRLLDSNLKALVNLIQPIKADMITSKLVAEFNARQNQPTAPDLMKFFNTASASPQPQTDRLAHPNLPPNALVERDYGKF